MKPDPRKASDFTVCDPACGTGGFLVAAYEWLIGATKGGAIDRDLAKRVKKKIYHGQELVERPRRLALMNLYLHGIEPTIRLGDTIYEAPDVRPVRRASSPIRPSAPRARTRRPNREDFTVETSNKQLNFVQHVLTVLKPGGRAAVVLPDNCLFADQAGEVFKILAEDCDLHTVLRLPRGTFTPYSQGVKANVVFFTKGCAERAGLDLRRPHERPGHHQEGPPADGRALCRVREVLWRRPERPGQTQRRRFPRRRARLSRRRSLAFVSDRRRRGPRLQARQFQVAQGRQPGRRRRTPAAGRIGDGCNR